MLKFEGNIKRVSEQEQGQWQFEEEIRWRDGVATGQARIALGRFRGLSSLLSEPWVLRMCRLSSPDTSQL